MRRPSRLHYLSRTAECACQLRQAQCRLAAAGAMALSAWRTRQHAPHSFLQKGRAAGPAGEAHALPTLCVTTWNVSACLGQREAPMAMTVWDATPVPSAGALWVRHCHVAETWALFHRPKTCPRSLLLALGTRSVSACAGSSSRRGVKRVIRAAWRLHLATGPGGPHVVMRLYQPRACCVVKTPHQ